MLRWRAEPLELPRVLELVSSPATLAEAIREAMPAGDRTAQRWLAELDEASATIREGFQTFVERLGSLLDSPAGRSLGTGPEAVRLADVLASGSKLLIRLDPRYGAISRKVGAWTLIAMLPELPPEPTRPGLPLLPVTATPREPTQRERRGAVTYMRKVIAGLETTPAGGRNAALNHAAWTLGHWVAAGALDQREVEDPLYAAAEQHGLVAEDGEAARRASTAAAASWCCVRELLT